MDDLFEKIPFREQEGIMKLLKKLDGNHGFSITDFNRPIPSEVETGRIKWTLKLKNFPAEYHFSYLMKGNNLSYTQYPHRNYSGVFKNTRLVVPSRCDEFVSKLAIEWLKTIHDKKKITEEINKTFLTGEIPYSDVEEVASEENDISQEEVSTDIISEKEKGLLIGYHKALNEGIQESADFTVEEKKVLTNAGDNMIERLQKKEIVSWKIWEKEWFNTLKNIFLIYNMAEKVVHAIVALHNTSWSSIFTVLHNLPPLLLGGTPLN